jgi:nucleotide-binding universal stress UspA family protein
MNYKTILLHVDQSGDNARRLALAARLATAFDAHLIGTAAVGLSRFAALGTNRGDPPAAWAPQLAMLTARAHAALDGFEQNCTQRGIPSWERRLAADDGEGTLLLQSAYTDLLVLGPPGTGPDAVQPAGVILAVARPVLLVPQAGADASLARILVAWDASAPALRALVAAMPLLQRAATVTLWTWGAAGDREMVAYLARQRVTAKVAAAGGKGRAVACGMAPLEAARGADLVVKVAYGHSRLREFVLGGVTRAMLAALPVPALLHQ